MYDPTSIRRTWHGVGKLVGKVPTRKKRWKPKNQKKEIGRLDTAGTIIIFSRRAQPPFLSLSLTYSIHAGHLDPISKHLISQWWSPSSINNKRIHLIASTLIRANIRVVPFPRWVDMKKKFGYSVFSSIRLYVKQAPWVASSRRRAETDGTYANMTIQRFGNLMGLPETLPETLI